MSLKYEPSSEPLHILTQKPRADAGYADAAANGVLADLRGESGAVDPLPEEVPGQNGLQAAPPGSFGLGFRPHRLWVVRVGGDDGELRP